MASNTVTTYVFGAKTSKSVDAVHSGVRTQNNDKAVRVQDDFYQYLNGGRLCIATITADRSPAGAL